MNKILKVEDISALTGWNKSDVYRYSNRKDNPLPLRCLKGKLKGAFAFEDEFWDWLHDASVSWQERGNFIDE